MSAIASWSSFDNEEKILNGLWTAIIEDEEARKATEKHRGKSGARILRDVMGTRRLFIMTSAALVAELAWMHDALRPVKYPMVNADVLLAVASKKSGKS